MSDLGISPPAAALAPARGPAPRRAWIAALAGLLLPPLGHVYAGRARRGMAVQASATFVAADDVVGHARWIYFSTAGEGGIRWDRIGLAVR